MYISMTQLMVRVDIKRYISQVNQNNILNLMIFYLDCLFWAFMRSVTNVTREDSEVLFRLMDINRNGEMDFEEFYLLFCILIATLVSP